MDIASQGMGRVNNWNPLQVIEGVGLYFGSSPHQPWHRSQNWLTSALFPILPGFRFSSFPPHEPWGGPRQAGSTYRWGPSAREPWLWIAMPTPASLAYGKLCHIAACYPENASRGAVSQFFEDLSSLEGQNDAKFSMEEKGFLPTWWHMALFKYYFPGGSDGKESACTHQ